MRSGWQVLTLLTGAALSAVSLTLALFDVGDAMFGERRTVVGVTSFAAFVVLVAIRQYRLGRELNELRDSLSPKVEIVFDEGSVRPYLQRTLLQLSDDVRGEEWRYRVGIRNLGKSEIPRVRAVLERIDPLGTDGFKRIAKEHIYPGQPLQAMGRPANTDEFLLGVSGSEPSVFVDVVYDHLAEEGKTGMICFAYASTNMPAAAVSGAYRIAIRVEGAGTYDVRTFIVDRDGKEKHLRMRSDSSLQVLRSD
jgi:hypothetical protein